MKSMNLYVEDEMIDQARTLPKNMSASRILRHLLRAVLYDDAEWREYAKTDECKKLRAHLTPFKKRLGID